MRTIGVVTTSRADYGIYRPLLRAIVEDPALELYLLVSGTHLSPEFGRTVEAIEAEGFEIGDRIEMLLSSDTPEAIAKSTGLGMIGFAQSFARRQPDLLVVLGDRFEMFAAAAAAMPFVMPIAHLHGGESTEGLIDEPIRHSITKMSHLHFTATEAYARRVRQMGEEPWRVTVSGALSLDNLNQIDMLTPGQLEDRYSFDLSEPPLLVTFHPVTLEYAQTDQHIAALLSALDDSGKPVIFTYPNADTAGRRIIKAIDRYVDEHRTAWAVDNLGTQGYFSLMTHAAAMVGNSSSGIIEAASFKLPVVNIGNRQRGRVHDRNVIDVATTREAIRDGIKQAASDEFHAGLVDLVNPYGDGTAAEKIVSRLKSVELNDELLLKRFYDGGE
ncbi:MAG: UDP-N-acetylglucosamine 2-epimerase (hydrolyzing) [Anaerolineae bacterium]|nr:UDP-N-acetylglucosamine 2-epimerase (hydrolyzing) [Anaerolineae bacterium]